MAAPAKARTNTKATPMPGTGTRAAGPLRADSEFADDPFIRRLARPQDVERDRLARRDIVEGLHALQAQRAKVTLADEYYDGDVGMVYASTQVKKILAKQGIDESEIQDFNYAKIPVDEIANRLQIAAVKVAPMVDEDDDSAAEDEDDDDGDGEDDGAAQAVADKTLRRAEKVVELIRKNNQLDVYEKELHKVVSKHGQAFLFLWPVEDETGKIVSVDFRVNTAHNVVFMYDPEDSLRVAYVLKSWETASDFGEDGLVEQGRKPVTRANLYYPGPLEVDAHGQITQGAGRVERWTTQPGDPANLPASWRRLTEAQDITDLPEVAADEFTDPYADADADGMPDEPDEIGDDTIVSKYGLTWYHFRNDLPDGKPEHEGAYGPQALINKLVWMFAGIIEYLGFPQRYLMVDPMIDDPLTNDIDPDHPEDEDDDPETETGSSGLRSDPAAIWRLFGKATGQYSAADPDTFMKPLDRFIKSMAELTGQPLFAFTKNSADLPSGEAMREANAGRTAAIEDRQARYDPQWQNSYELALRMMGITGITVDVRWKPAAPVNDLTGINVLKAKGELGVPSEVLLNEAGYPDDQIDQWTKSHEGLSMEQRINLFTQVSTAVQALAAGVTAGVVPDNMAQALIARFLGNIAEGTEDAPADDPNALPAPTFRDPPPVLPPGGLLGAGGPVKAAKKTAGPARTGGPAKAAQPRKAAPGRTAKAVPKKTAATAKTAKKTTGGAA